MPLCHPFKLTAKQEVEIAALTARAAANVSDRLEWASTPRGLEVFQQQMAEQTIQLPFGFDLYYAATFTVAKVHGAVERCLNIAVPQDLHAPTVPEAEMIAKAFGFNGSLKDWRVFKVGHERGQQSFTITLTQPLAAGALLPGRVEGRKERPVSRSVQKRAAATKKA